MGASIGVSVGDAGIVSAIVGESVKGPDVGAVVGFSLEATANSSPVGTFDSVDALRLDGATVGEYVGRFAVTVGLNVGKSVRCPDAGADVGNSFDVNGNSSLVGLVGSVKVLKLDGATVGEYVGSSADITGFNAG